MRESYWYNRVPKEEKKKNIGKKKKESGRLLRIEYAFDADAGMNSIFLDLVVTCILQKSSRRYDIEELPHP